MLNKLWVEKYRPKTLAEVIFATPKERQFFESIVKTGLPNLLLTGPAGTGKTTLSTVLPNELKMHPADVLRINCSDEKIDAMREKVKTFAYTMPMGEFKLVRLEEMDNLSMDAQKLLRDLIEQVSNSCRFIATGNYLNRIIPALQDRFQMFNIHVPSRDDIAGRAVDVLTAEQIEFDVEDVLKVVEAGYPSVRRVITLLEQSSKSGKLVIGGDDAVSDWKLQLLPLLETGNLKAARELVCSTATSEELVLVYRFLYENLHRVQKLKGKIDAAIVLIAQYQYQHQFVELVDAEIQIAALFVELGGL